MKYPESPNILGIIIAVMICTAIPIFSQSLDTQGLISATILVNDLSTSGTRFGVRYLPSLSLQKNVPGDFNVEAEFSLNAYSTGRLDFKDNTGKIKPYRLWFRLATPQFEARVGLQKINFGSAMLLRPLMWFDHLDPRDPLQITDGVYALLLRYYFLNNANIWLWGIYGQDETKGLEAIPTEKNSGECGGRIQYPFLNGEIAASYHHREINTLQSPLPLVYDTPYFRCENRYALDGKWDFGIGLWFEGVLVRQNIDDPKFSYRKLLNIGTDNTFAVGNGLHALTEFFVYDIAGKATKFAESMKISALLLDYNLDIFDQVLVIGYYDWKNHDFYRFATWRRTFDKWSFNFSFFWNPEQNNLYSMNPNNLRNEFTGKGIQLVAVFNY